MSSNYVSQVGSAISPSAISFFTCDPLTSISTDLPYVDKLDSFSWNCNNKLCCYAGSSSTDVACLISTDGSESPREFAKDLRHNCVKFLNSTPDQILTGGNSRVSVLWEIKPNSIIALKGFKNPAITSTKAVSFNTNDTMVAIGGTNDTNSVLLLYDIKDISVSKSFSLDKDEVPIFLEVSPYTMNQIALASVKGTLYIYDASFSQPILALKNEQESSVCGMCYMPQSRNEVCLGYSNNRINIYDLIQRRTTTSIVIKNNITSFTPLDDGINFLVGSEIGALYQFDKRKKESPVDVLRLGSSKIDGIFMQKGSKIVPKFIKKLKREQIIGEGKNDSISTKKRRAKESEVRTPISNSHSIKDFKNLFISPAIKKVKPCEDLVSEANREISQSKLYNTFEKDIGGTNIIRPRSVIEKEYLEKKSPDTLPDSTPRSSTFDEIDNRNDSIAMENLMYSICREFRQIQFDLTKQHLDQTREIKESMASIITEIFSKEKELIQENQRLREEILQYKHALKNSPSHDPQE